MRQILIISCGLFSQIALSFEKETKISYMYIVQQRVLQPSRYFRKKRDIKLVTELNQFEVNAAEQIELLHFQPMLSSELKQKCSGLQELLKY